jgi:hypothetical protein
LPPVCLNGMVIIVFYHTNWWGFITEMEHVYCAVSTGCFSVTAGHKRHATDPCEVPSSPSHNVLAVCSLAVRWDRSRSWISVWLTAPAVPVVRQLTVNMLLGASVSEEWTAFILVWQSGSGGAEQVGKKDFPSYRPKSCLLFLPPSLQFAKIFYAIPIYQTRVFLPTTSASTWLDSVTIKLEAVLSS